MITATPYFLSRLSGNQLRGTFGSYFSLSFTGVNFIALAYATVTASPVHSKDRIRHSAFFIIASMVSLAVSPLLPMHRGVFFSFVILNGMLQACAGSFLQSAVVGLAALFGSELIATMFTGQAVVGIVVSTVQYIAAASASPKVPAPSSPSTGLSLFAFIFFGLASGYMVLFLAMHSYLLRLPAYQSVIGSLDQRQGMIVEEEAEDLEDEPFLGRSIELQAPGSVSIVHVAKSNAIYNLTVAWVFIVTLVSPHAISLIYSFTSPLDHFLVNIPPNHKLDIVCPQELHPQVLLSDSIHLPSLPDIQYRRLARPIYLFVPSIQHLVATKAGIFVTFSVTLHTPFPRMQYFAALRITRHLYGVHNTSNQLRLTLHTDSIGVWHVEWVCRHHGSDGGIFIGA